MCRGCSPATQARAWSALESRPYPGGMWWQLPPPAWTTPAPPSLARLAHLLPGCRDSGLARFQGSGRGHIRRRAWTCGLRWCLPERARLGRRCRCQTRVQQASVGRSQHAFRCSLSGMLACTAAVFSCTPQGAACAAHSPSCRARLPGRWPLMVTGTSPSAAGRLCRQVWCDIWC